MAFAAKRLVGLTLATVALGATGALVTAPSANAGVTCRSVTHGHDHWYAYIKYVRQPQRAGQPREFKVYFGPKYLRTQKIWC